MQFWMHGQILPAAAKAFVDKGHKVHATEELAGGLEGEAVPVEGRIDENSPADLLAALAKRQWNLLTTDAAFVREVYENKVLFPGCVIVLILDSATADDQVLSVERLFERYKRLTPRRLYTVTPGRVKIRQLPGEPD